ncbi:retroviral-like aspartic protease family protein [Gloeobacter kilaueensis]|uniref:retroviral-like aspartic protease family protein n=1 Tax=Gloeobacter kilaueensis TaxID=1416614 RepID=UPI0003F83EF3|nr:retroviral-like aspartic protease family protein [Gloeobacter kilaueensis]
MFALAGVHSPVRAQSDLGAALFAQIQQCLVKKLPNLQRAKSEALSAASQQCFFNVVVLDERGARRIDANERTLAVLQTSGVRLPVRSGEGEATVPLGKLLLRSQSTGVYTVAVTIAGRKQDFLLDTGADSTIISAALARQLRLPSSPVPIPGEVFSQGVIGHSRRSGRVEASAYYLPVLGVGTARLQQLMAVSLPLAYIPGQKAGILGLNAISAFDMVIDPRIPELRLLRPSAPPAGAIPLTGQSGLLTAAVTIAGAGPFRFALDTGAGVSLLSKNLARQLALDTTPSRTVNLLGFGGSQGGQLVTLPGLSLGPVSLANVQAVVLATPLLDQTGLDGLVGQNFLNHFRQHWRFAPPNPLGIVPEGTLELERQ